MTPSHSLQRLSAQPITRENFQPYGQFITPSTDSKPYGNDDAQLDLSNGTPRFYIMRLQQRGRTFHTITRHQRCTQCLGSLEGKDWLIAVAPPSESNRPDLEQMKAFRIPGNGFIKLARGTWHAGPYFDHEAVDFYNLELSDTNKIDYFTHNFREIEGLTFEIL
ncbi:ureidoglycolate lyase [Lusitaniella coriacea]|uniref:ureidoglycolate lyase n=1 Tax=Lusitaniella coriacea TaxID=1983105 RepID=UPI003CEF597B